MSYTDYTEMLEEASSIREALEQTTDENKKRILEETLEDFKTRSTALAQTLTTSKIPRPKLKIGTATVSSGPTETGTATVSSGPTETGTATVSSLPTRTEETAEETATEETEAGTEETAETETEAGTEETAEETEAGSATAPERSSGNQRAPERSSGNQRAPDYDRINKHAWDEYQGHYNDGRIDWNLSNNLNFPNFINRKYDRFKTVATESNTIASTDDIIFPHQDLIKNYLAPETPYRGVLLYHGLGSGKTRTSIDTALQFWRLGWRIVLLVPGALKDNFIYELKRWSPLEFGNADLHRPDVQKRLRVHIITYNHYTVVKKIKEIDLLQGHTVLIIDEVHDLMSQLTKPYNKSAKDMYQALINIKNSKIIALTGTPIVNSGYELGILFNILRGPICPDAQCQPPNPDSPQDNGLTLFPAEEEVFEEMYIDYSTGRPRNGEHFKHRIMGLISYYRGIVGKNIYPDVVDHGIILVNFSPEGFMAYEDARALEREQEDKTRILSKGKKRQIMRRIGAPGDGEQKPVEGDTFRVKTRLLSNFVLPPELERPEKADVPKTMSRQQFDREIGYRSKTEFDVVDPYDPIDQALETGLAEVRKQTIEQAKPLVDIVQLSNSQRDRIYQNRIKKVLDAAQKTGVFQPDMLEKYAPKFKTALQIIGVIGPDNKLHDYTNVVPFSLPDPENPVDKSLGGLVFVYSNFRTLEGLSLFAKALEAYGYRIAPINASSKIEDLEPGVKRYAIISGDEDSDIRTRTLNIFNDSKNKYGQYIKILLGTSASAKGISLRNLRQNIHLDPHWNEARPDQVKGRGRRIKSHIDLPKEEQNLHIYRIMTVLTDDQKIQRKKTTGDEKEAVSTDYYIYNIAQRKKQINEIFETYLREAAFDCDLNKAHNTFGDDPDSIKCLNFGQNPPRPPEQYSYLPDYRAKDLVRVVRETKSVVPFDWPPIKNLGPGNKTYDYFYELTGESKFYALQQGESYQTFRVRYENPKTNETADVDKAVALYQSPAADKPYLWFLVGQRNPIARVANIEILRQ